MSLENTDVTDRKNFTNNLMAQATSGAIIDTTVNNSEELTAFSIVNSECIPGKKCEECLNIMGIDLTDTDAVKNAADSDGVCGPVCSCSMSNANLTNKIVVDFELSNCGTNSTGSDEDCPLLDDQTIAAVVDSVTDALQKEYGDDAVSSDTTSESIETMFRTIVQYMGNVTESVSTLQILNNSNSTGSNIENITMDIALNAILKAQYDSNYSESLNDIISDQTTTINDYVDKTVQNDLSYAWSKTKVYFFIILGVLVFLIVLIIIMYVLRALKK